MQRVFILGHTLFEPGRVLITSNANEILNPEDVTAAIDRHLSGDWGDVCPEDRRSNNFAVKKGLRLLSAYKDRNDVKFWVITEADRSYTTVLLPSDY